LSKHRIIISVTNDLSSDQRVHKVCSTLYQNGFDVLLVGRLLTTSKELTARSYATKRMKLFFTKGVLFYAEYQLRLLILLLVSKFDSLHANDLDTLLPNYLASRLKRKELVYDSHEYFTEVPELQGNPVKKKIWELAEGFVFPHLKYVFTVNQSIADVYKQKYQKEIKILRNVPAHAMLNFSSQFQLPDFLNNKPYAILQGAGINVDRGAEELVEAMQYVNDLQLLIIGAGDVIEFLKKSVVQLELERRVFFIEKLPYEELLNYTHHAAFGLTLDKDTNLNYRYSLPNKIFDYAAAGIPILASSLIETKRIFDRYPIGLLVDNHQPKHIAEKMQQMMNDKNLIEVWRKNAKKVSEENYWENEVSVMLQIYLTIIKKQFN
jgi:glycosyltransferase involved in cell wall biosynthesis